MSGRDHAAVDYCSCAACTGTVSPPPFFVFNISFCRRSDSCIQVLPLLCGMLLIWFYKWSSTGLLWATSQRDPSFENGSVPAMQRDRASASQAHGASAFVAEATDDFESVWFCRFLEVFRWRRFGALPSAERARRPWPVSHLYTHPLSSLCIGCAAAMLKLTRAIRIGPNLFDKKNQPFSGLCIPLFRGIRMCIPIFRVVYPSCRCQGYTALQ